MKLNPWTIGAGILAVILAITLWSGYNGLQGGINAMEQNQARMESAFKRQADLIPNLVEVTKGYVAHERGTLEAIAKARATAGQTTVKLDSAEDIQKYEAAQKELSAGIGRLLAVAEQYPNLKADTQFTNLQRELTNSGNQINASRVLYIRAVADYNRKIRSFPSNLVARIFGFELKPQFTATPDELKTPQVKLS